MELEPALKPIESQITGATYTDADESGDARKFTQNLAAWCATQGVSFKTGTTIKGLDFQGDRITGVRVIEEGRHETLRADAYVLAMGSFSPIIAKPLGLNLMIYPAKGYSATVPVKNPEAAFFVSLTDDEYKLVFSRLGDRLRIAGTAELNGYSTELNDVRCQAIIRRCRQIFPEAGVWEEAEFWTGLRPATPLKRPLYRWHPLQQPLPEHRSRYVGLDPCLWLWGCAVRHCLGPCARGGLRLLWPQGFAGKIGVPAFQS